MSSGKRSSFWLALHYISTMVFSFISLKLNIENFGTEIFGVWIIFSSLFAVGGTIDLGFGMSLIRFIAEANSKNDIKRIKLLASNALVLYFFLGTLIAAFEFLIAQIIYLPNGKLIPLYLVSLANRIIFFLTFIFFLQYINSYLRSIIEGMGGFVIASQKHIVFNLFNFLSALVVFFFHGTIVHLLILYTINALLLMVVLFFTINKNYPMLRFSMKSVNIKELAPVFKFSVGLQLSTLVSAIFDPCIKYLLGNYTSLTIVSFYEIARRLASAFAGLYATAMRTFLIKTSSIPDKESYKAFILTEIPKVANFGIYYAAVVFGMGTIIVSYVIIGWFQHEEIVLLYLLLALPEILNACGLPLYLFFYGIGNSILLVLFQVINLIISVVLVGTGIVFFKTNIGLLGITFAVIFNFFLMVVIAKKITGVLALEFLRQIKIVKLFTLIGLFFLTIIYTDLQVDLPFNPLLLMAIIITVIFYTDFKRVFFPLIIESIIHLRNKIL